MMSTTAKHGSKEAEPVTSVPAAPRTAVAQHTDWSSSVRKGLRQRMPDEKWAVLYNKAPKTPPLGRFRKKGVGDQDARGSQASRSEITEALKQILPQKVALPMKLAQQGELKTVKGMKY